MSVIVKGATSAGKSHLLSAVLALLPPESYVDYTSVSPRYLVYADDDLRHRIVVLHEAAGVAEGHGAYLMRSLLSEGRLRLGIVTGGGAGAAGHLIDRPGPTALFTTTTRAALDPDLETRALSLEVRDDRVQRRAVLQALAQGYGDEGDAPADGDHDAWHALGAWLAAAGERRVRLPFAAALAEMVPCTTTRVRRDFRSLLALIAACALLHQAQRQRAADGALLASLEDYAALRPLVAPLFGMVSVTEPGLTEGQRQAEDVVRRSATSHPEGVGLAEVARALGIDKSAASRRLRPCSPPVTS